MARPVHLLGEGGRSACCGKSMSSLGLGAMLTDSEADVTCSAYSPPEGDEDYLVEPEGLKLREGDQPLPTVRPGVVDVQSQVIADIVERREVGISRYGTALQPHNGRDALRDLYEELLDGAMYAKQLMLERSTLLGRIAELEAEKAMILREIQS